MNTPLTAYRMTDLEPGDHLVCLYNTPAEHRDLMAPFIAHGLTRNEKVIYLYDAFDRETICGYVTDENLDPGRYLSTDQLSILPARDMYMPNGQFDPERMIKKIKSETTKAIAEGYAALRITSETTWALTEPGHLEKLILYESKAHGFFPGSKCLAVCQYDRTRFDPKTLLRIMRIHPITIMSEQYSPAHVPEH